MVIILCAWLAATPFEGWETLSKLELVKGYDEFLGEEMEVPVFSKELKSFDGEIVTVSGYVIPLETSGKQDYFVLSRFPFNNCFFCGNAGQETVMEVYCDTPINQTDAKITVTGRLKLNDTDPMRLFFILSEAKVKIED
ncbi:MAG: hypothetical protein ACJA2C_000094 [Marinoscillum sp.]|jgi:hypothetical protein